MSSVKSPEIADTASRNGLATLRAMTLTPEIRVVALDRKMLPASAAVVAK